MAYEPTWVHMPINAKIILVEKHRLNELIHSEEAKKDLGPNE